MKKLIRIIALALVLASMFTVMSSVAFAATSKKGTNQVFFVETGKSFWGAPTVKITNTGSTKMCVVVTYANGRGYTTIGALSPKQSTTIKLKANSSFRIMWSGTYSANATGTITSGRAIKDIC